MRKIYSIMLMAAALLISTNMWAYEVNNLAELKAMFSSNQYGDAIELGQDIEMGADDVLWLGTACIGDQPRSITLDLNGHNIYRTGSGNTYHFFVVTHGELIVINSGAKAYIGFEGGTSEEHTTIFSVYGSYKPTNHDDNALVNGFFSHVEIGPKVKLQLPTGCLGTGIAIDVVSTNNGITNGIPRWASKGAVKYTTAIMAAGYGYSYGVQVDVKGNSEIESLGGTSGAQKSYGIKTNGNLSSPLAGQALSLPSLTNYSGCMSAQDTYFTSYDANAAKAYVKYVPFVHVHPGCTIKTTNLSTKSAAVYASGYAKWLIEGDCSGNIGVSISSGDVDINNATIASTATGYSETNANGGVSGSGSAIVINSRNGYAGDVDLTITGNSEITADGGYAIEEVVHTTSGGDKVENIDIESASIKGGDKGAIVVTTGNVKDTYVYAATINGDIQIDNNGNKTTVDTNEDKTLGGLVKGTTTSSGTGFDEDKDYIVDVNTSGEKPAINVSPNLSKVVTMNAYGYSTFSAVNKNRVIKAADSKELTVYIAESVDNQQGVLNLAACNGGLIPQNTGVIFKGEPGKTYILDTPTGTVAAVSNPLLQPASAWTATPLAENNLYTATTAEMEEKANQHLYVLAGNELLKYKGNQMKANKAYLQLPAAGPYGAPKRVQMVVTETEETQAVDNVETTIEAVKFMENGQIFIRRGENIYNVQGQIVK